MMAPDRVLDQYSRVRRELPNITETAYIRHLTEDLGVFTDQFRYLSDDVYAHGR